MARAAPLAACLLIVGVAVAVAVAAPAAGRAPQGRPATAGAGGAQSVTAAGVVARNVAARGGAAAWHKIHSMIWVGRIDSSRAPVPSMHFTLYQQRPNESRFEVDAEGTQSVRVFDGKSGWKIRGAGPQGGGSVEPFSPLELEFARQAPGLDGRLIDYAKKGSHIELKGMDTVDGHRTYVVQVHLAGGEIDQVWLDAKTFLERKLQRNAIGPAGRPVEVLMYYHDYKVVHGVTVPSTIETASRPGQAPDRIVIERMMFNAPLKRRMFEPPAAQSPAVEDPLPPRGGGL